MKVFFNYVVTAFDTGFFKLQSKNFVPLTQIFVMFVKNGFLNSDQQNKFFISYMLGLKQTILPDGGKE